MAAVQASTKVYFGESCCEARYQSGNKEGQRCSSKAYYKDGGKHLCGGHSSAKRKKLMKNPNAAQDKQDRLKKHQESVEEAQRVNQENDKPGEVTCAKMRMMAAAPTREGFLNVYPNFKHQNRSDGFGCSSLSPMSLGPVNHLQKDLPTSKCLENYHQFNKVFDNERKGKEPNGAFRKMRLAGYKSSTPMRHKPSTLPGGNKRKAGKDAPSRKPAFSVHSDPAGVEKCYTWVESRYFYCHFYEELSRGNKDLQTLRDKLKDGVNIQITGFDGFEVNRPLYQHYESTDRPFGHEMVLYCLLTMSNPKQYPWNQYYLKHKDMYPKELAPSCYGHSD